MYYCVCVCVCVCMCVCVCVFVCAVLTAQISLFSWGLIPPLHKNEKLMEKKMRERHWCWTHWQETLVLNTLTIPWEKCMCVLLCVGEDKTATKAFRKSGSGICMWTRALTEPWTVCVHSERFCSERPELFRNRCSADHSEHSPPKYFPQQLFSVYSLMPCALPTLSKEDGLLFRKIPKIIWKWQRQLRVVFCPLKYMWAYRTLVLRTKVAFIVWGISAILMLWYSNVLFKCYVFHDLLYWFYICSVLSRKTNSLDWISFPSEIIK